MTQDATLDCPEAMHARADELEAQAQELESEAVKVMGSDTVTMHYQAACYQAAQEARRDAASYRATAGMLARAGQP